MKLVLVCHYTLTTRLCRLVPFFPSSHCNLFRSNLPSKIALEQQLSVRKTYLSVQTVSDNKLLKKEDVRIGAFKQ